MKSIGSRITLWYATTLTATLACLFIAGHFLLDHYLLRQLDELNEAQFKHLKATLGRDYAKLTPVEIDDRIRQATESASSLFYIDMHGPMTNRFFKSSNLHGQAIPDIAGERAYSVAIDNIGEVRVSEFQLAPFDVIVATPLAPVRELMTGYRLVFFGLLGTALVLSVVVGYGLSRLILHPVRVIQTTANRIRSDNLSQRIPVGNVKDEVSQLAAFLNQMFDRLEMSFAEIRRFAAEASHELKTPVAAMSGFLQVVLRRIRKRLVLPAPMVHVGMVLGCSPIRRRQCAQGEHSGTEKCLTSVHVEPSSRKLTAAVAPSTACRDRRRRHHGGGNGSMLGVVLWEVTILERS